MAQHIEAVRALHEGWLKVLLVTLRDDQGHEIRREIIERGDAVAVLPYDAERRVALLVRLPRAPVLYSAGLPTLLEACAGMLDGADEDPDACARREAMEEAGLQLGDLEPVGRTWLSSGVMTERIQLYLAPYRAFDRKGTGGGLAEEHEDIEVEEIALDRLAAMADAGEIEDLKTLALIQTLRVRRRDLFTAP